MRWCWRRWLAAACLAAAMPAQAGERVAVAPQGFDVTMVLGRSPLFGYLGRPPDGARRPAVVELHGCQGFGISDRAVADRLQTFGYVALALESLGGFNACGNGANGALAEAYDAYLALDWLTRRADVDPGRVAILGFGMGGSAGFDAVERGLLEKGRAQRFRAAVAFYPSCREREGVMTAPTLVLVGDKDDWSDANWCRDMVAGRDRRGAPIDLVVYPDAAHDFAEPGEQRHYLGHLLAYDAKVAEDAWRRVRDFLQGALSEPGERN